jgi:hypothetical protein
MSEVISTDQKGSAVPQHDERAGLTTAEAEALYATVSFCLSVLSLHEIYCWIGWIQRIASRRSVPSVAILLSIYWSNAIYVRNCLYSCSCCPKLSRLCHYWRNITFKWLLGFPRRTQSKKKLGKSLISIRSCKI